ncbi:MAG: hypothetical protein AAF492_24400, partial [Verrucomicrobiota bacterium]
AFKRECLSDLVPVNGIHRLIPAYMHLHRRRIKEVPVRHRPRIHGKSKYTNWGRLPKVLFQLARYYVHRTRLSMHQSDSATT